MIFGFLGFSKKNPNNPKNYQFLCQKRQKSVKIPKTDFKVKNCLKNCPKSKKYQKTSKIGPYFFVILNAKTV